MLQQANPTPSGAAPNRPALTRAIGRASVVLTSSHLERYIRNVNEEAVDFVNAQQIVGAQLPESIRLLHSKSIVEELSSTTWNSSTRVGKLVGFASTEVVLWNATQGVTMEHGRLLAWMRTPKPEEIKKYYAFWGIDDIFSSITYKPRTRSHFWLKLTELVDKRNNIAHGDLATNATQADVRSYISVVEIFCQRADRQFARRLSRVCTTASPW